MNESLKFVGAAVAGLAVGLAVGYKIADKRQEALYFDRLQAEEESMRVYYEKVKKPYSTPEEAVADLIKEPETPPVVDPREKAQKVQYNKMVQAQEYAEDDTVAGELAAEELLRRNVFDTKPDPEKPYLISQEEFMQNETEFDQLTLTYYEKGGVLTDEREDPIEDMADVVGTDFPAWFGAGSSDTDVVHIRNEKLRTEFEVQRSERSYEEDVLGENEPESSYSRRRQG